MRQLFLVLAKLFGLYHFCYGLLSLIQTFGYLAMLLGSEQTALSIGFLVQTASVSAASLGMAWLLIAKTDWLANKLGIPDGAEAIGMEREPLLFAGVALLGVYLTVNAIPTLGGELVVRGLKGIDIDWRTAIKIVSSIIQLGLGLFLTLRSATVVEVIIHRKAPTPPFDSP